MIERKRTDWLMIRLRALGKSKRELADRLVMFPQHINRLLDKIRLDPMRFESLAKYLEVTEDGLWEFWKGRLSAEDLFSNPSFGIHAFVRVPIIAHINEAHPQYIPYADMIALNDAVTNRSNFNYIPNDTPYSADKLFSVKMDEEEPSFPSNSTLICATEMDPQKIENGKKVICAKITRDDSMFYVVRVLTNTDTGTELWKLDRKDGDTPEIPTPGQLEIRGIVIKSIQDV